MDISFTDGSSAKLNAKLTPTLALDGFLNPVYVTHVMNTTKTLHC